MTANYLISKLNAYTILPNIVSEKLLKLSFKLLFTLTLLFAGINSYSQNCTVNAGVDQTVCPGVAVNLVGTTSGLFQGGSATTLWTQVSGPVATITTPSATSTTITGTVSGGVYRFRLTTTCLDGTLVYDDVIITVRTMTTSNAGTSQTYCPGTYALAANAAGADETGAWSGSGAGVTVSTPASRTSNVVCASNNSGNAVLTWTITNTTSLCTSTSTVTITNKGGATPVSAGTDKAPIACYSSTTSSAMTASYAGTGIGGQGGVWTVLSGPNVPTIASSTSNTSNITNLIPGTYRLRWTVSGSCASGNSTVNIVVPSPAGASTTATITSGNQTYCDTRTETVLIGSVPTYAGESVTWTKASGPACTIVNPNSPTTAVTGLSTAGTYRFTYNITNSITGCSSTSSQNTINYALAPSISITSSTNMILAVDASTATVTYSVSGGTSTQYAIIRNPSGAVAPSWLSAGASSQVVSGLTSYGMYTVRFRRYTASGTGVCTESDKDVNIFVSKTPTASNAGTNQTLACNVTSTQLAGNPPAVGIGVWYQVSGPNTATIANTASNTTNITGLINGQYKFRWSISAGVNSPRKEKDVIVYVATTNPSASNAGAPQTVCYSTPVTLAGNTPALNETGTWTVSPSSGVIFSNANSPTAVVTGLAISTAYTFTWTIRNACSNGTPSNVVITTMSTQGPTKANAGADQCLASGTTTATLGGNDPSPGTGLWSQLSGPACTITMPSSRNSTVTSMTNGNYLFLWTLSFNGCATNSDTLMVTISAAATTSNAGTAQTICGTSTTLAGNTPTVGTGIWAQVSGPGIATFSNVSSPTSDVSNLSAGVYTFSWTINNNACASNSSNVTVNIGAAPTTANAGADIYICPPTTTGTLAGNTITTGTGYWNFVSGPSNPTFSNVLSPTSTISGLLNGTYTLQWIATNGPFCPVSSSTTHVIFTPAIGALTNQNLCNANTTLLTGTNQTTGTWDMVSGPNTPTIDVLGGNTAEASGLTAGTYVFRYTIPAAGSCIAQTANINVVNSALPTAPVAGIDQQLCNAANITLAGNTITTGIGTWTKSSGPGNAGTYAPNANSPTAVFTPQAGNKTGTFIMNWTVVNGNCSAVDQFRIDNWGVPTTANAGTDQSNVCGLNTTMAANTPTTGVGTWSFISGPETPTIDAPVSPSSLMSWSLAGNGTYVLRWTISNGSCTASTDDVNLTVNTSAPTTPTVGADQPNVCGTSATLSGNTITVGTGAWQFVSGPNTPTFIDINNPLTTITGLIAGAYIVKWTSTNVCGTLNSSNLTITVNPSPTTPNAGSDQTSVCYPAAVTLAGNTPTYGTGLWTQLSGPNTASFNNTSLANTGIIGTIPGTYVFRWTVSNICASNSDDVSITIYDVPTQSVAGAYQNLCNVTSVSLDANTPSVGTGAWSLVSGPNTPTITSTTSPTSSVTGLIAGTYTFKWTISNNTCTSNDNTEVIIDALSTSDAGTTINVCGTTTATMAANTPDAGTGAWTRISGSNTPTITNAASPTTTITGLTIGTYVYRWTVTNGTCVSTSDVSIIVSAVPTITGTTPGSRCESGTVILGATASAGTINWYAAATGGSSLGTGISFTTPSISNTTTYYVDATYNGNTTPTRTAIAASVYSTPTILTTTAGSNCGTGSVLLGASASAGTVNWYTASTGGSAFDNGTSISTPSISSTTTYYVDATNNGCTTASRTSVVATIKPIPAITSTTPGSRSEPGTVNLAAASDMGTINWYADASGGASLGTGTSFTTPSISSTTTYYVDATLNGCTSGSRTSLVATVNNTPAGFTWTAGGGSADWNNPANWSDNAVPDMNADVMIPSHPSGGNIFPSVYVANAVCKSITIQTGASLNVNSGKNIAVYGDLANSGNAAHGNGTFTFCGSAAQTISGTNTFANLTIINANGISLTGNTEVTEILTPTAGTINTNNKLTLIADARKFGIISGSGSGIVSGNVNVQKQFLSYKRYFYISAPVTCTFQQVQNFMTITGWNASYKIGQWSNVWKYDETDIAQVPHPYGVRMNGWIAPSSLSDALEPFKGYALYVDAVKTTKLTLNGAVNNGPISIPVSNTSSVGNGGDHMDDGWNLVGNPYPCPINWESGAGWSKNNIDNAIYSYDGKCYKTFVNGIGVPSDVNGIIAPMQGFYIHASANSTLAINNAARVNSCTPNFYKKAEEKTINTYQSF